MVGELLEVVGLALLVAFAATFGVRWGLGAGGVSLLVLGMSGGVSWRPRLPRLRRREQPYGVVRGRDL